jgi:hypothetical protein
MAPTHFQAKITVGKLIQLAYSEDSKGTAAIVLKRGNFKLVIDQTGKAKLYGSMGDFITFNGDPALKGLGFKLKRVSINFSPTGDGRSVNYTGTFRFVAGTSISVNGSFDIFDAIKSCSGLLCNAARLIDGRDTEIEQKISPYFH